MSYVYSDRLGQVKLAFRSAFGVRPPDAFAEAFWAVSTPPPKEPKTAKVPIIRPPPFDVLREGELWEPRPPLKYIVDGFLPVGCLGMICALGESYKSWMLADMALAVAKGRPWLGAFPTGAPKRVLYMDYENNEDETARRVIGLEPVRIPNFHAAIMPSLFLTDKKFLPEIENLARQYDFVAIDSLSGGSEDINENDAKFAQCLRRMKRAGTLTGTGFVVLHHSRKPMRGRDGEDLEESNKKSKPRGTNAIYNALDSLLDVDSLSNDRSRVTHTKQRGPRRLDPFTICIQGIAPEPTRLFVLSNREIDAAKEATKLKKRFAEYRKKWDGSPMSGSAIAKVVRAQKQTVLTELKAFVKAGWLSLEDDLFSAPKEASPAGSQIGSRGGSKKGGPGNHLKLVPVPTGSGAREPAEPA